MNEKNSIGLIVGLVCIIVILIGFIGYLVLNKNDNLSSNVNNTSSTTTTTTTSQIEESNNSIVVIENASELLTNGELKTNFSNLVKTRDGLLLSYSCKTYESGSCLNASLSVDNKINTEADLNTCGTTKIYKNSKYYIIEDGTGCGSDLMNFTIYDLNGNNMYYEPDGTIYKNKSYIENNIYYYNTYKVINENEHLNTLYYKSIDLSKNTIIPLEIKNENVADMPGSLS